MFGRLLEWEPRGRLPSTALTPVRAGAASGGWLQRRRAPSPQTPRARLELGPAKLRLHQMGALARVSGHPPAGPRQRNCRFVLGQHRVCCTREQAGAGLVGARQPNHTHLYRYADIDAPIARRCMWPLRAAAIGHRGPARGLTNMASDLRFCAMRPRQPGSQAPARPVDLPGQADAPWVVGTRLATKNSSRYHAK